jgi:glycosyltransferase involved in cell wall biosynthesis
MSAPSISVLLPVHNAGRFLRAAVASILAQTHRDFELIAVDDGSTDASGRILDAFAATDSRVRLISRPNTGIVGALNDGLAVARGEFIARMDADDIAEPGRLEQQLAHLLIHPEIIALGTFARVIDPAGHVVGLHEPPCGHDAILARLLDADGGALLHPSLVFRRSALEVAGAYDPAFCRAEDLDFYFRLSLHGGLANLPEPLLRYRQHPASTNFTRRAEQRRLLSTIVRRERAARGLPGHDPIGLSGPSDYTPAELHRHWACGARRHGTRHAALRHAFAALLREGPSQANWRTLRYVTGI